MEGEEGKLAEMKDHARNIDRKTFIPYHLTRPLQALEEWKIIPSRLTIESSA